MQSLSSVDLPFVEGPYSTLQNVFDEHPVTAVVKACHCSGYRRQSKPALMIA